MRGWRRLGVVKFIWRWHSSHPHREQVRPLAISETSSYKLSYDSVYTEVKLFAFTPLYRCYTVENLF